MFQRVSNYYNSNKDTIHMVAGYASAFIILCFYAYSTLPGPWVGASSKQHADLHRSNNLI